MRYLAILSKDRKSVEFIAAKITGSGGTIPLHQLKKMYLKRFNCEVSVVSGENFGGLSKKAYVLYPVDDQEKVHLPTQETATPH